MSVTTSPVRQRNGQQRATAASAGLPDPRPLTDYTVALTTVSGPPPHARITVTLTQPCVIRSPMWAFIDCTAGAKVYPSSVTVVDATTFYFDFPAALSLAVAFVDVPYQDMQVQNFQGGFVVPGGKWFRKPVVF